MKQLAQRVIGCKQNVHKEQGQQITEDAVKLDHEINGDLLCK